MKKVILSLALFMITFTVSIAQVSNSQLPASIYSGKQGKFHVQGVVIDKENGYAYFSFTNSLIKTDLSGKMIGSVTGFMGHLGDLDFDEKTGKIYGSLEYKNDAIGKGINKTLGVESTSTNGFYIAIFDGAKIVRPDMPAEEEGLLQTVYLHEPVLDYEAQVIESGQKKSHRYACSGIDGVALAPAIGKSTGKNFLYVAYGVYGDTTRQDNDYQVILKYDISTWDRYGEQLKQGKLHQSGPSKPHEKYFVKTGNTRYGIQNLAYDSHTGHLFAAVYMGKKSQFPNYDLFVIDGHQKPKTETVSFYHKKEKIKTLSLLNAGPKDNKSGIRGWYFKWGATGLCPLGDGLFYISHNDKTPDGQQQSTVYKYRWVGNEKDAFVLENE